LATLDFSIRLNDIEPHSIRPQSTDWYPAVNAVRLQPHALDYNLANFLRTMAMPEAIEIWSLTSLRERLIKTGARLVRHARYVIVQMAEAALPRTVFAGILGLINGLRGPPVATVPA
jgi:hypothetical protein